MLLKREARFERVFRCSGGCVSRNSVAIYQSPFRIFSTEEPLNQFIATDFKMRGYVAKNSSQCSYFKRIVIGNGDMVLTVLTGR
jgi:hypothetical protein